MRDTGHDDYEKDANHLPIDEYSIDLDDLNRKMIKE